MSGSRILNAVDDDCGLVLRVVVLTGMYIRNIYIYIDTILTLWLVRNAVVVYCRVIGQNRIDRVKQSSIAIFLFIDALYFFTKDKYFVQMKTYAVQTFCISSINSVALHSHILLLLKTL